MPNDSYVHIHELRQHFTIVARFSDWQRWKLKFPLFALVLIYPIYKFFGAGEEFVRAFGHGDLLLFSALVLIELSVEVTHINHELRSDTPYKLEGLIENAKFFGLILIFIYGSMKFMMDKQDTLIHVAALKARAFCVFSLAVTFLSLAFSIFAFWITLSHVVGSKK
jgi:hypothetical protein